MVVVHTFQIHRIQLDLMLDYDMYVYALSKQNDQVTFSLFLSFSLKFQCFFIVENHIFEEKKS